MKIKAVIFDMDGIILDSFSELCGVLFCSARKF